MCACHGFESSFVQMYYRKDVEPQEWVVQELFVPVVRCGAIMFRIRTATHHFIVDRESADGLETS